MWLTSTEEADQAALIAEAVLGPYIHTKDAGCKSIRALIFDRCNVILIAKTSFGKSMIPQ